jgi:diacylglycerol kinase
MQSLINFFKSFTYAVKGIRASFHEQRNIKVQLLITAITLGAGFYFNISEWEWCAVLLTIGLVLSMEMVNTAIENLVDLVSKERSSLAGKIKDLAAGAVLMASVIAVIVGLIVFRKYLM